MYQFSLYISAIVQRPNVGSFGRVVCKDDVFSNATRRPHIHTCSNPMSIPFGHMPFIGVLYFGMRMR